MLDDANEQKEMSMYTIDRFYFIFYKVFFGYVASWEIWRNRVEMKIK